MVEIMRAVHHHRTPSGGPQVRQSDAISQTAQCNRQVGVARPGADPAPDGCKPRTILPAHGQMRSFLAVHAAATNRVENGTRQEKRPSQAVIGMKNLDATAPGACVGGCS